MGKFLKIALALFLIGIGTIAVVSAVSDQDILFNISDTEFEKVELSYDEDDFSLFDLNFENRDFFIRESDSSQIKVVYYVSDRETITVSQESDELVINHEVEWLNQIFTWFSFLSDSDYYDVYIYLPTNLNYDFDLDTSNGILDIINLSNINDLSFHSSNGRINLNNVDADKIDASTSNGRIDLTDVSTESELNLYTSNGRINLANVESTLEIYCDTSNGSIQATDVLATDVTLETSNGDIDIQLNGLKADYRVDASTTNGDIDYDGLEITNGVVNNSGIYELNLDTSNGDITISFIE